AYVQYWRINLLTMIEYRANFFMWFGFTIVYHASAIAALYVTLHQFPSMNGWDFRQIAFLYGLWMLGHAFHNTFFFTVGDVPTLIREGRFDRFLVRPLDPLFQAMTVPQQIWPDELILAIIFFCFATAYSGVRVDLAFVAYVPLVMLGGALIDFGIQLAIASAAFWVIRIDTLRWVVMSLEQDFTRYPISIYSRGVRFFLSFVFPFAFMNYFPATYLLHKTDGALALAPQIGLLTPLVGLAWFALAYAFWRVAVNRYQGTGS
ncbi:MAG: ABC-2 family transporter protein, partial [Candidatus Eremiobacteraeota bacterium]|nr:ABC-2 family transporter protein [Candidatus Eremiobacteraeota bacterium]